jgi:hypothetical protein
MASNNRVVLPVDAAINLALGLALLIFPPALVRWLGMPSSASRFYPGILGAVLFGIGLALLVEHFRKPRGLVGLGLGGAVAINLTGGAALAAWLVFGRLGLPVRGLVFLWALVFVLVGISLLEATRRQKRLDHEPPSAIAGRGWRYHHLGIPTTLRRPGERHLERLKLYVSGFDTSPYGIEWMRFEPGCEISELVRTVPHIAFEVDDLDEAVRGLALIGPITSPSEGVRVAMIVDDGAPVELIELAKGKTLRSKPKSRTRKDRP